ncbi:YcaO-like family protein [Heyndrickxia sporothermodurans]|uniref:YcaO-like family protein n=1 Tax=Heyndrickxia sporothermodurans TaxID=46224 RepID=UPI002DBE467B|nr:YcaO-like family protein [Heyndrickxia sporothermodurans]MEB6551313.1 YcaO-like family protein [Heyndrickxia sporothermodurans]
MSIPIFEQVKSSVDSDKIIGFYRKILRLYPLEDFILKNNFLNCSGFHYSEKIASQKALGEAIERYTMNLKEFKTDGYINEISKDLRLNVFTDHDPVHSFDAVAMINLKDKKHYLIPEQFVNFRVNNKNKQYYPISSNGFAAHVNKENAITNGILECIERHIVLQNWAEIKTENFRKVILDDVTIDKRIKAYLKFLAKQGWHFHIFFLISDINLPTILTWGYNITENMYIMGASCSEEFEKSLENSLLECLSKVGNKSIDKEIEKNKALDITNLFRRIHKISESYNQVNKDYNKIHDIKEKYDVYYKDFSLIENVEQYGFFVCKVHISNLVYYWDRETYYLKKLESKNSLFDKYGIFSLYIY